MNDVYEWLKERRRINKTNPFGDECWADAYDTLPALLTAVEKVLELHDSFTDEDGTICWNCTDDLPVAYPCPTVQAIEGAIST